MDSKKITVQDKKGKIKVIELHTLANCLPVKDETYSRIIHGLMMNGYIRLSGSKK